MDGPLDVGCLSLGETSAEQRGAYDWCVSVGTADRVSGDAVAAGDVDLGSFDAVWWHASDAYTDPGRVEALASPLTEYLLDGGGLLLSLRALSAVAALGVDPVPPDVTGIEPAEAAVGPLVAAPHAAHPLFEGLTGLRPHTRLPGGVQAFARYEEVLPARGTTLAGTVHDDTDRPGYRSVIEWAVGDGAVLGVGTGVAFEPRSGHDHGHRNRDRFVRNALSYLSGDAEERGPDRSRPGSAAAHRALRDRLSDDRHRPIYHITPPANWLNDPNGLCHWNGRYHVFYQYNPSGPFHGSIHWGHAVSDDLVTWEDRPLALSPDPDGPDRDGCWSGCTVDDDGTPTVVYTGGRNRIQLPCLATAVDGALDGWEKHPDNPVIAAPPPALDLRSTADWQTEFRDHSVWREGDTWYQLIGSGVQDVGGTALLYRGASLTEWEFVGPLLVGDRERSSLVWECPELLRLGGRDLLHVSNYDEVRYFLGEVDLETPGFDVRRRGILDHGDFYAPQSMRAPDGRTLTWGWLPEARDGRAQWDAGWSGALSVPRELDVVDGRLRQRPAAEVAALRSRRLTGPTVHPGREQTLARGRSLDVSATVDLSSGELVLTAHDDPETEEATPIRLSAGELVVDRRGAGGVYPAEDAVLSMPVDASGTVDLRVLIDRSVIEIFVDDHSCLTARVYPHRPGSDRLTLSVDGDASVESLSVWSMDGIWSDGPPDAVSSGPAARDG